MIQVQVKATEDSYDLSILGHANPILCCSVSTMRLMLEDYLGLDGVTEEGECFLSVMKEDEYGVFLLTQLCNMFDSLVLTYPEEICFEFLGDEYGENRYYSRRSDYTSRLS